MIYAISQDKIKYLFLLCSNKIWGYLEKQENIILNIAICPIKYVYNITWGSTYMEEFQNQASYLGSISIKIVKPGKGIIWQIIIVELSGRNDIFIRRIKIE